MGATSPVATAASSSGQARRRQRHPITMISAISTAAAGHWRLDEHPCGPLLSVGVPVGFEVAQALHAPLDVLAVRKLGAPRWPELAIGAVAEEDVGIPAFLLCPLAGGRSGQALAEPRLERAIGVIYRRATERASHYLTASLARQFDALVHIDETRAVEPLEGTPARDLGEPPETYPTAN